MSYLWLIVGGTSFALGVIGIPLPGWPTTIFWIIAAYCFANSRPEWRDWIYARPGIGPVVEDFNENGVLSKKGKFGALLGMTLGGGIASFFLWQQWVWLALAWAVIAFGAVFVITRSSV